MTFRDRIAAQAARVREQVAGEAAEGGAVQQAGQRLRDLREAVRAGQAGVIGPERFLVLLVGAARSRADGDEGRSAKHVRRSARKRHRRLGIASWIAGPFAGVAGEVTDLYSETATVCDLVDTHGLQLEDEEIAAHMLVLWSVTDDLGQARGAVEGTQQTVASLVSARVVARWSEATFGALPERLSTVDVIKLLWKLRDVPSDVRDLSDGSIRRVARAGSRTKQFIARAEQQLTAGS
jgi:hypothetical protein